HHELDIHFKAHTTIAADGRYIVRIPLRGELTQLGDSLEQARRRLFSLERKLSRHEPTYDEYRRFMRHYTKQEKKYARLIRRLLMPSSGHSTWTTYQWVQQRRKNYVCSDLMLNKRSSGEGCPYGNGLQTCRK
uniref:Uncharacterized protein n=1 Tax=Anopheles dirus TaxID=7168 RepID=A0A182NPX6_9DIPT